MISSWKPWCLFLCVLTCFNMPHQVEAQGIFDQKDCYGGDCCKTSTSELWRGFSCSMYTYLDDDPVLMMEGCAKHGEGCVSMCTPGNTYDEMTSSYADCDRKYDKNTVYSDWSQCFFGIMIAGLIKSTTNAKVEKIPPENVTDNFCNLLSQPGCPLCIKMRWGSPCTNRYIKMMCPVQCKTCLCNKPDASKYQGTEAKCEKTRKNTVLESASGYGDTCELTCPADTSAGTDLRCIHGEWTGVNGDPRCMRNCDSTGITLPPGGSGVTRTSDHSSNDCSSLKHMEKCKLYCESGTSPSAYWQCYNGKLRSTFQDINGEDIQPQCLANCKAPPVPDHTEMFGECTNPVLDDPDANFEFDWSSAAAYARLNGKNYSVDFSTGVDTSTDSDSPLRDQLQEEGILDLLAETCSVLKEENEKDPINEKFEWRRLQALNPKLKRDPSFRVSPAPLKQQAVQVDHPSEGRRLNESTMYVPRSTPHGSNCTLKCKHPFSSSGKYSCWNGTYTMPKCSLQLFNEGVQWPIEEDASVVSYLTSVYADYNLDIINNKTEDGEGKQVTVCAEAGLGCPTGQCFAAVPVEDTSRVTTQGSQLRVRLGYDIEKEQRYGCNYEITIPAGTVVAVLDRTVGNAEQKWTYRLDPSPPRLMKIEMDPSFSSVYIKVKYNSMGTIKCLTLPEGEQPTQDSFDVLVAFWSQVHENEFATGTLPDLKEKANYGLWCQATGISGLTQSMVDVVDNHANFRMAFQTKSKRPFLLGELDVVNLGNTEITIQVLWSNECEMMCAAQQSPNEDWDQRALDKAAQKATRKVFIKEPLTYTISGLEPNTPTQIMCRAFSEDKTAAKYVKAKDKIFWQDSSDAYDHAIVVKTPPMTHTELGTLTAEGCDLVPPFSPDRAVYGCAIHAGRGSNVKLSASVDPDMYSSLSCKNSWVTECRESFAVSESSTWKFKVKAQSDAEATYVIVLMTEPPVEPKEMRPQILNAVTDIQNMTICATASSDIMPKVKKDKVAAQLLPGPWDLPIVDLHTGSGLPSCKCNGCNVELTAMVRGAGANLTLVLFIDGVPSFSLKQEMKVHFHAPEITDVNPPKPSVYEPTVLTVYGHNFGGTNKSGATINVKKVGPPIPLPAATWMTDCPLLSIEPSQRSTVGQDTRWVYWEFGGRYTMTSRGRYTMNGDRKVLLNEKQLAEIDEFKPTVREECTPRCAEPRLMQREIPVQLREWLVKAVGICCFGKSMDLVGFDGNLIWVRIGSQHKSTSNMREFPTMRVRGNVWQIDSVMIRTLRMHSERKNLRQKTGWMVKYKPENMPPGPGEEQDDSIGGGGRGGRRLSESLSADQLAELSYAVDMSLNDFELSTESPPAPERLLWDKPPAGRNWTKNSKGQWSCSKGVDDDSAVTALLKQLGYDKMVPKNRRNCELLKRACYAANMICQCTCEFYDPTPSSLTLEEVNVQCERCGDGVKVGWEMCDDGNLKDGDGCSRICEIEEGWTCNVGTGCTRIQGDGVAKEEEPNLCGPTTWVDDGTLKCELQGSSRYPIALSVEVRKQESTPSQIWIQYVKPQVRTMLASVVNVVAGSADEWSGIVEFQGGQRIILNGRSLPPTQEEGKKHMLTMLIGETILCAGVDVKSSTQFECPNSQPLDLERVTLDPQITIRVGEVSSQGMSLSDLGLVMRQPHIDSMSPNLFNDTDLKRMVLEGSDFGAAEYGRLVVTVGGALCVPTLHLNERIECDLHYAPDGNWTVKMTLGKIPAVSVAKVTVNKTYCHPGFRRVELETSECTECEAGTFEDKITPDFTCKDCFDGQYQNNTGRTVCQTCVEHSFSVPNRSDKEWCRCKRDYYHAYGDVSIAEECTRCEKARGFGWATSNWTIDCPDCVNQYTQPPEDFYYYGSCPLYCYGLPCLECPTGATCFGNAAWPRVLPGFWAHNVFESDAQKIERCMPMEACLGDDGLGTMICKEGYEGIRCGVCELGFYKDQHICHKCPNNQWIFAMIFMLFFLVVLFFGIIPAMLLFMKRMLGIHSQLPFVWRCWFKCCCCLKVFKSCGCGDMKPRPDDAPPRRGLARVLDWDDQLRKAPLLRTLAMCLNFGHTCYAFAMLQRPQVAWPGPSWELLSWTKLLTIDVEFMKPDCVVQMPFFTKWVGKFFMPFGMFAILLLITCFLRRQLANTAAARKSIWSVFRFSAALIVHVILIWHLKVALSPVDCNWCREGVTCLDEYTLVECWGDDPTWIKMMILTAVDFVLVSGFFPIFLSLTIYCAWRRSARVDKETYEANSRQLSFTAFFVTGYKDRFTGGNLFTFGWEVVVLFRKLGLIVSAKFTSTDPILGANIQLLILLASLVMQLTMRPYKAPILCNIDNFLCTLLFLSLLSACQLTMGGLGDMEIAYIIVNVAALFGGAITAVLVTLRKLQFAYLSETSARQKAIREGEAEVRVGEATGMAPVEEAGAAGVNAAGASSDVKVMDVEDSAPPMEFSAKVKSSPVKAASSAGDNDSETAI